VFRAYFALSTVGSIVGTVVSGFFLFAAIGTLQIILLSAAILAVLSFVVSRSGAVTFRLLVLIFIALSCLTFPRFNQLVQPLNTSILDTAYQRVHIQDQAIGQALGQDLVRRLITDPLVSSRRCCYLNQRHLLLNILSTLISVGA
jgi:hypothetical protein